MISEAMHPFSPYINQKLIHRRDEISIKKKLNDEKLNQNHFDVEIHVCVNRFCSVIEKPK